ncbi:MAG: ATP-binding protein [Patescibacteria group bacterium]
MIVFGLDPLKRFLSRVTDKIFFKAKVDYAKLLQRLSGIVSVELDLQKLIDELERGLIQGLKVKSSLILLRDQDNGQTTKFRATTEHEVQKIEVMLDNASPLVQFVRERRHLSLLESLERRIEDTPEGSAKQKEEQSRAEFERIGAALVAPIFSEDHLVAILTLGPKLSGDSFSNDDIQLIDVLAPQIGSAIQKANLYEEVRQFGESLKVKVEEATAELQERNVSLQTLQTITKDITRTLDFGKVVQNIANAVSTELGFLGAILVFLDDDGKTLRARAVTETSLTKKAIKLLPKPFTEYATDYTQLQSANLGVEVIRTGGIRFTESMAEVISPPIPKPIVFAMQKLMGIKTMILVPIVSEERVIGVIEVGAKRKREEISRREIETLQSMADELGVVARNITLFDRVRKTNDQLEVANKHLQELDRAKSEFVSIASHQLRTPMTGIMGYLSMMTQGDFGAIKPEHQKILVDLLSESQRMIRLINLFLNVSKIEAGKFTYTRKPTQLTDLVAHEVKEIEKAAADKGLKLTVKSPKTSLPLIQADADKLEDVILNLLDNAIKYTAKGTVTATVSQADGMVRFAVKDSGIGIKPTDAPELFNKFVRGSGIAQIHPDGSGLGLFIAKSIIDAHGGRIWAESEGEGQGSTFQFTLPINPPAEETSGHDAAAHVTSAKRL